MGCGSGRGGDALVIVLGTGATGPPARARSLGFGFVQADLGDRADCGREEVGDTAANLLRCQRFGLFLARTTLYPLAARTVLTRTLVPGTLIAWTVVTGAIVAGALVTRTLVTRTLVAGTIVTQAVVTDAVAALVAFGARLALLPVLAFGSVLALARLVERLLVALAVELLLLALILVVARRRPLVLEARAGFPKHPEVVIGELEVIFGLHTVAGELRIAGHVLVLLKQLRGIAPAALLTAIAAAAAETLRTLTPATAAAIAATLAIVHQA